ncbi:MAG: hypothetical protein MHM6MM_007803 [Cercozoa sp. M6MM]
MLRRVPGERPSAAQCLAEIDAILNPSKQAKELVLLRRRVQEMEMQLHQQPPVSPVSSPCRHPHTDRPVAITVTDEHADEHVAHRPTDASHTVGRTVSTSCTVSSHRLTPLCSRQTSPRLHTPPTPALPDDCPVD